MSFEHSLREGALKSTEGRPVQERCDALNLIDILDGELTPDQIVERVMGGTLPEFYKPLSNLNPVAQEAK
jgi:hypothetical protein